MPSDGISAAEYGLSYAASVVLPELNPQPMGSAPSTGRCPKATLWKSSCKSRGCPVCGPRWARDQQRQLALNLEHAGVKVATIAITGPGADVLPWDDEYCRSRGRRMPGHKHAGPKGCRCQQRPLREWCETLPWRWKKLREAARMATKRELNGAAPPWVLARVWEPQKRGVPHLHLVVPYGSFEEKRAAGVFRGHLARLAPEYGFGRVQGKLQAIEGSEAARYLANYLAGRTGKKSSIRQNIADPRLPASLVWLTPILSSVSVSERMVRLRESRGVHLGTGVTMRTMRRARHLWACFNGVCDQLPRWKNLEEAVTVAIVFRSIYPKRAGPAGDVDEALAFARDVDRSVARRSLQGWKREVWNGSEYVPNEALFQELTELAFVATRGAVVEAA